MHIRGAEAMGDFEEGLDQLNGVFILGNVEAMEH